MSISPRMPSLAIQAASPNHNVNTSQLSNPNPSAEPSAGKPQITDCPKRLDAFRDNLSMLLADDQADPHVDIEAMSEEEFMDYTVAQIRAGKLDLVGTPGSNFEDEAIGEHFLRYPFLY